MPIESQPRYRLATLPTPLQEAKRLREALGGSRQCPRILIKRDDLTGLAFGGNKARKLEFLVADALQQECTFLVTTGAEQSNHARMTAAAARAAGLGAALILTSHNERPEPKANLLLDYLFGAEIHFVAASADPKIATGDGEAATVAKAISGLEARGERPYLIPIGGSSAVGALGYVTGTLEIVGQLLEMGESPTRMYYAAGSRGTQASLVLGAQMYSAPYTLCGIAVSGGGLDKTQRAVRIANETAELLGLSVRVTPRDIVTDENFVGEGYGIPTPGCLDALRLLARQEGILLDPIYTGKVMAGLIEHIRQGLIEPSETVVFLHTGGAPALFAYGKDLGLD